RELSPVEVTRVTLERIDRLNPKLNAYLLVDHEGALAAAREAERCWSQDDAPMLCGVPVSIKDLVHIEGMPTTFGSLVFKDYYPERSSVSVERLQAAGAVVLGKTNTPEIGMIDQTINLLGDDGRNPWNLEHTAGGSSGGAGSAVAAGLGPLALGTDGAGSIRIPAFYNAIFGLKPTFGRIPHDGWKGAPLTSHQGPMTRTVGDAVLFMQATAGPDLERDALSIRDDSPNFFAALNGASLRGTKVALSHDYGFMEVDSEIRQAVMDAADLLRGLGCEIIESDPPRPEGNPMEMTIGGPDEYVWALHLKPDFDEHLDELTGYGRHTFEGAPTMLAWKYAQGLRRRERWAALTHLWFQDFDFLVSPVMGRTAPRCRAPMVEEGKPWPGSFLPIFNANGSPAASIPFGFHSNGLPLAVQIAGRWGDDVGVLRVCAAIEAAQPWADQWPPLAREGIGEPAGAGD
ncbi:MAG: amidase, partial [Dehalococcoidia bacterium]